MGYKAQHVFDVTLAQSKELSIWKHAQELNATIITKDEDVAEWIFAG